MIEISGLFFYAWIFLAGLAEVRKNIAAETSLALAQLAERTMQLQCTIQDGQMWLSGGERSIQIGFETLKDYG